MFLPVHVGLLSPIQCLSLRNGRRLVDLFPASCEIGGSISTISINNSNGVGKDDLSYETVLTAAVASFAGATTTALRVHALRMRGERRETAAAIVD